MLTDAQKAIVGIALGHYGDFSQRLKFIEECGEAIQAVSKDIGDIAREDVASEIADVLIMVESLLQQGVSRELVKRQIAFKVTRLEGRINSEKKRKEQLEALHD